VAVPPIRDENTVFVEEPPEQGLDAFDSEVSLGMLGHSARVERTTDLDLFPSEQAEGDDDIVVAASEEIIATRAVVAADRRTRLVSPEQRAVAVAPERPAGVTAIPQRASVFTTRRLALVAGIFACLGVPTVSILLWRSPARVVAPAAVVRDGPVPSAASLAPREPIPTTLVTPPSEAPTTLEPTTEEEPLMPSEAVADSRGPIATPAPAAVAPSPSTSPTARSERLTTGTGADTSGPTGVPITAEKAEAPATGVQADLKVPPYLTATIVSVDRIPSVNTSAAESPPPPPKLPPAAPVSAPAVAEAGGTTVSPPAPAPARDAADIQVVLTRYRSAFSDLDATTVSQVWPTVDARALARAFRGLEEQGIAFDNCDIRVTGASAAAACDGTVRYVTKVGSKDPRTERRRWQFTLSRVRDVWMIQTVESR
jgi:hypothetical protein